MRNLAIAVLVMGAMSAGAQTKVFGKMTCEKPSVDALEAASDVPGHLIGFAKANCAWVEPAIVAGMKAGPSFVVEEREVKASTMTARGYNVIAYSAADSAIGRFEAAMHLNKDGSGAYTGTWTYVRGTGKLRGIQGGGTFKGTAAADGSTSTDVSGDYTLGAAGK